jgi:hypothetical protein
MNFGEIIFDVRGVIQLRCWESETLSSLGFIWNVLPERVTGIPVGRRLRRMHCLHAAALGRVPDGTPVATWVWHYQDGSQAETQVIYGRDLRGWWKTGATEPESPGARVVWTGTNPVAEGRGATLRLFLTTYENPQPDRDVVSLDYQSKMTLCAPFLVALTVE